MTRVPVRVRTQVPDLSLYPLLLCLPPVSSLTPGSTFSTDPNHPTPKGVYSRYPFRSYLYPDLIPGSTALCLNFTLDPVHSRCSSPFHLLKTVQSSRSRKSGDGPVPYFIRACRAPMDPPWRGDCPSFASLTNGTFVIIAGSVESRLLVKGCRPVLARKYQGHRFRVLVSASGNRLVSCP